jgi:drug/metabolite transporter (DMT)-like permease
MHYLFLTACAIILWSSLAVLAAQLGHLPPFFILAICLTIGGSLSLFHWKKWHFSPKLLFIGVGGIFGYHFLLFMALRMAPPVSANLLNYLWPLFILLFSPLFLPEFHLTKRHLIGTLLAFTGAALVLASSSISFSADYFLGYIFAIFAALTWAIYSLLSKKIADFSSATVGLFCLISGGLAFIAHFSLETTPTIAWQDVWRLILLGIGPMGLAFYCWDGALKKGDPRLIATLSYFTPLLSTGLLIVFNKEPLTPIIIYSLALIVGGAMITAKPKKI